MSRHAIVFAGPSLGGSVMALPDGVALRGPARRGDMLRAAIERPAAIGLIDGLFETTPSVWHKEIIQVMAEGIAVYGAASLGALRAAELAPFGMVGIGAIAQAYEMGQIERDDAVMVSHAPAELGHRAMTLALVDAEHAIAQVEMAAGDRALLLRLARRMNFRDRCWALIGDAFRQATGRDLPPIDQGLSLKRADAELLLRTIAGSVAVPRVAPPPQSFFLRSLRAEISAA
ncbi:TfuA-like protein [Sphingobium sp.]|jgi:hypothetical protein|uniref:TfuA-like protein n=1 Tax=Sphingobium sp. TaxID=1912891 RepID=UPI00257ED644|nr:TfuA-like protein [Sphingobium sp.]MBR2270126.1 TfuA-like protein [Sphingobium sp.]